ncbi:MAG: hypothetical protein C0405_12545, partial [Desulfovibrio sp.]|nr:hypothetical protein [Desulfovibrio sp.]
MNRRRLFLSVLAALSLCLWLGVAVAQQAPATPAADAVKAAAAVAGDAAKTVDAAAAGAAKAVEGAPKASKLADAIAKAPRGTEPGMIDESKPVG